MTILDGGMGQELVHRFRARTGRAPTALWSSEVLLSDPDLVSELHADYVAAGADVITLATYSATPERLRRDGHADRFDELQRVGFEVAERARKGAGRDGVRIAASLPPLVGSYHPDTLPPHEQALASYRAIVTSQRDRADLMLCETMASIAEAEVAAIAALESDLPVWVALTVSDEPAMRTPGHEPTLRSGESVSEARDRLTALGVHALLLNCSLPESIEAALPSLAGTLPTGAYANAFTSIAPLAPGGNVDSLTKREDLGPSAYAAFAERWAAAGASIVGGCCETDPAHIAMLAERLR